MRLSKKYHAHDEKNEAKTGDIVRIEETRPLSKQKRWALVEKVAAGSGLMKDKRASDAPRVNG